MWRGSVSGWVVVGLTSVLRGCVDSIDLVCG